MLDFLSMALPFVGGLFGQSKADKQQRANLRQSQAQFDSQMDESVQRRVADAKKAGIHPLFALGGSVGASPTVHAGTGDGGKPMQEALVQMGSQLGIISANKARSRLDEAQAAYYNAQAAKVRQGLHSEGRDLDAGKQAGVSTFPYPEPYAPNPAFEVPIVATHKPGRPGTETGVHPRWKEYRRSDGSIGKAFSDNVPGSEELNVLWIPLQDWWHTSKRARSRLRQKLGITTSDMAYLQSNPQAALEFVRRNKRAIQEMRNFHKAVSGPPIR